MYNTHQTANGRHDQISTSAYRRNKRNKSLLLKRRDQINNFNNSPSRNSRISTGGNIITNQDQPVIPAVEENSDQSDKEMRALLQEEEEAELVGQIFLAASSVIGILVLVFFLRYVARKWSKQINGDEWNNNAHRLQQHQLQQNTQQLQNGVTIPSMFRPSKKSGEMTAVDSDAKYIHNLDSNIPTTSSMIESSSLASSYNIGDQGNGDGVDSVDGEMIMSLQTFNNNQSTVCYSHQTQINSIVSSENIENNST